MITISLLSLMFIFLVGCYLVATKNKYIYLFIFFIVPLCLLPIWMQNEHNLFIWIKLFLLLGAVNLVWLVKMEYITYSKSFTIWFVLFINIAEAVIKDILSFQSGGGGGYHPYVYLINAACGLCVLATIPRHHFVAVKNSLIEADCPLIWIAAYLSWNWAFIVIEWPSFIGIQSVVIGSSIVLALIFGRLKWFEARAITITAGLMFDFSFGDRVDLMLIEYTPNNIFGFSLVLFNLVLSLILLFSIRHEHQA